MEVNSLSEEQQKYIDSFFYTDVKVSKIMIKIQQLKKQGKYYDAIKEERYLEDLHARVIAEYLDAINKDAETIDLNTLNLPKEDVKELNTLFCAAMMTTDMLDTCLRDMNDVLKRHDNTLSFESLDDINSLAKSLNFTLGKFYKSKFGKNLIFSNETDNLYQMLKNKAAKVIRKIGSKNSEYTSKVATKEVMK